MVLGKLNRIVVIGAGQAGVSLVAKLRRLGYEDELVLVGEEPELPYQRPPLTKKYLLGELERERLRIMPAQFYSEQKISLELGVRAEAIDPESSVVLLSDGRELSWDILALTTGSEVLTLPEHAGGKLSGIYAIRTIEDVDKLAHEFAAEKEVLVIGGGYIGLEASAVARSRDLKVVLVEMQERILKRVASQETAAYFTHLHQSKGVDILTSAIVEKVDRIPSGKLRANLTNGRVIDSDFIIIGLGIRARTELASRAGLLIDNGIAVDEFGRTSAPGIFAAGDCASFEWDGQRIRLESVQNAIDHAENVAASILGKAEVYNPVPWFWSDQYDVKLQIAGLNTGFNQVVVRPGPRANATSMWYFDDNRFLAVDAINDPRSYMTARKWLAEGVSPDRNRLQTTENLADCLMETA